jgi:anti-anti-sigma regulatory factor
MTRTRFSAGLHALLGAHRRARAEGGEVRFVVTGPAVRRILAIMAIDR